MSEAINYCWFDCDPGIDDAFAILLASHAKNIKIIGMSTVSGNHHIDYVTENAFKLMNLYGMIRENGLEFQNFSNEVKLKECEILGGMKFPLIKGNARPLLKKQLILADEVHGEDGLGSSCKVDYPAIPRNARVYFEMLNKQRVHFTTHIYRALFDSQPNKITIIATGPLTNIALLLINHPDSKNYIEKIVMMGGNFGLGNVTAAAEYNIFVDPEAASVVFESGVPIHMTPLQCTNKALVTYKIIHKIKEIESPLAQILAGYLEYLLINTGKLIDGEVCESLHDPCIVAYLIEPSLFQTKKVRVFVETHGKFSSGQTICDMQGKSGQEPNATVCTDFNVEKFWSMVYDTVRNVSKRCPLQ